MQHSGFEVHLASAPGDDWNFIDEVDSFQVHTIDFARQIHLKKDLVALYKLIKLFRSTRPQIVHTHTPKAGFLGMLAAWLCGVPIRIHTLAGMPLMTASGAKRKILFFTEKLTFAASTETWPNSKLLLQYVLQHKMISPQKVRMILSGSSNGISLQKFSVDNVHLNSVHELLKKHQIDKDAFVFLAVGRMVNDKGIAELVDAFIEVNMQHPQSRLLLLGPFEEADALNTGVIEKIKNHGSITHVNWSNEVELYMAASHCFVHPSHREGFPNVVLQAGAMALPVICSNIPGNIDIVESEEEGFVFPVKDTTALKSMMLFVMENYVVAKAKAERLREKIVRNYDRATVHQAIKARYLHLLKQKNIDVSSIH